VVFVRSWNRSNNYNCDEVKGVQKIAIQQWKSKGF